MGGWQNGGWDVFSFASNPPSLISFSIYNVKTDYGAKGDGVTNDTAAIQAAITAVQAAGGGIVYFPQGTFIQNAKLVITAQGVTIQGAGKFASTLKRTSAVNQVQVDVSTAPDFTVRDMRFDPNGQNQTSNWHTIAFTDPTSHNATVRDSSFINVEGFACWANFTAALTKADNVRYLDLDIVQNVGATHDTLVSVSRGGMTRGCRLNMQAGSGLDSYESDDHLVSDNTVLLNGATGNGCYIASGKNCTAIGNTVLAGNNDTCFHVLKETDNAFARASLNTLLANNVSRGTAGTIHYKMEATSQVQIVGGIVDTGYFIQYNVTPIDQIEASHVRMLNLTAMESNNVAATNVAYHDCPGNTLAGVAAIIPGASPYTYTAGRTREFISIDGGTVTTVVKSGITLHSFGGAAARCGVWLEPSEALTVTYTVVPVMNKDKKP